MFVLDQVSVRHHERLLLDSVSLKVQPSQLQVVVGANGAGKSTLLKLMTAEAKVCEGNVWLNQRLLSDWPLLEQARMRAMLPQSSLLTFPFRAKEVVMMGRSPFVGTQADDPFIIEQVMNWTNTTHLQQRIFPTLSGGEQQRVQLARVLAQIWPAFEKTSGTKNTLKKQPRYLLMDEPTSALDLSHQHQTLDLVKTLVKQWHIGALVVLHDLNLAAMYADHMVLLKDGCLLREGTPQQVLDPAVIHAVFGLHVDVKTHPSSPCPLIISQPLSQSHSIPYGVSG